MREILSRPCSISRLSEIGLFVRQQICSGGQEKETESDVNQNKSSEQLILLSFSLAAISTSNFIRYTKRGDYFQLMNTRVLNRLRNNWRRSTVARTRGFMDGITG